MAGIVYASTLCPTVYWYDSAEFAAHAAALGVPHPPGYPAYTLVAHAFTWLPVEPALGVNIMSLVFGLISVGLLYDLARRLDVGRAGAAVGAATLALMPAFWSNAIVAEVYTPGLAFTLGTFVLLHRGLVRPRARTVWLAALVAGVGVGMHMSIATLGLGYAFLVLSYRVPVERVRDLPRVLTRQWRPKLAASSGSLGAVALGLCVFLYIPLRRFERWDARDWTNFVKNATGGRFKNKLLHEYDVSERLAMVQQIFVDNLQWVGILLALVGLVALLLRYPRWGTALLLAAGGNAWWFFNYDVPDLHVFYLPALAIAALGVGAGIDALAGAVARRWPSARHGGWVGLGLPLWVLLTHYQLIDMSERTDAGTFGEEACALLPPGAMLVHWSESDEWERYSVILYMQKALRECTEVHVVNRPSAKTLDIALERGQPVYAFLRRRFGFVVFVREGPLYRIEPKSPPRSLEHD